MKTSCATTKDLIFRYPSLNLPEASSYLEIIEECWDDIVPYTFKELTEMEDQNMQAAMFTIFPVHELFENMNRKKLIDSVDKKGSFYELYEVDLNQIGMDYEVKVLHMQCPSTQAHYWVIVDAPIEKAEEAVAWRVQPEFKRKDGTPMIDCITSIDRQGESYIFGLKGTPEDYEEDTNRRPINTELYWSKLRNQT
jgi:hypothetical protein